MTSAMLVNGQPDGAISPLDRGLSYGDGLFESIRFVGDRAPLWARHMQRLVEGCRRLQFPPPDIDLMAREAYEVNREFAQSVVRITLTRGVGERGYALPSAPAPTRIVAAFAPPAIDHESHLRGVRIRVCELRLAAQPRLAGIKHLNRLEQVLARAEWSDPAIADGLLCDHDGSVISTTMANVFALIDGELCTPALNHCGVAGVARAEVLAVFPQTRIGTISLNALRRAEEIFLSSSVRGIVPVQSLDDRVYAPGATARTLQRHWRDLGFSITAFSMEQAE